MYRLAIISDIHSNHIALDRCIDAAKERNASEFLFLGDYLGELAYPRRTLERLSELKKECPCTFIRGNKEDYWIDHAAGKHADWTWKTGTSGSGMLRYTYDSLTPAWYRVTKAVLKGINTSQMTVLSRAAEIFRDQENGSDWRNIPEKYWDMALAELNI